MKYCKKCKRIHGEAEERCSYCKKPLTSIEDKNTPVYLITAKGFEVERIEAALSDSDIPCGKVSRAISRNPEVFGTGYGDTDILVPYAACERAYDICVGIGSIHPDGEETKIDEADIDNALNADTEKVEEMSAAKRTTVKIVSAILLIIVFAAVILGVDYIGNLIKGLLM